MAKPLGNLDRSPRAPDQTLTPLELAHTNGVVGRWLLCRRTAPGPCKHGAQFRRRAADIIPHTYQDHDGVCQFCPMPASHIAHQVAPVDPDLIDVELRMLGEHETENQ